jgi:hypothetical protein
MKINQQKFNQFCQKKKCEDCLLHSDPACIVDQIALLLELGILEE